MCKVIAISNQKGGCGKTTTSINLGVALARKGKKVLCIDSDPQGNLSMGLGVSAPDELEISLATLFLNEMSLTQNKQEIPKESYMFSAHGVDFIPSNINLSYIENQINSVYGRENILKKIIAVHKSIYDYIIIDCLPSLNILTVNALSASDEVIIPVQSQFYSARGLEQILQTIIELKKEINPKLAIGGILMTMVDNRSNFHKTVMESVENAYSNHIQIFNTQIPLSVKVTETQSKGIPIFSEKKNAVADSYLAFADELLSVSVGGEQNE